MRDFSRAKRIVVKIGTSTLSRQGAVDTDYVRTVARQVARLRRQGRQVVLVTSGAIGMGAGQLALPVPVQDTQTRQACAAVGQPLLMAEYRRAFARHRVTTAQVLLTADVLNQRKTYLNLRNAMETLLHMGAVPIVNENDCVATDEIGSAFGDNDRLSARIAGKLDADLLILLSDIDGLYDKDPRRRRDARPIKVVYDLTPDILRSAGPRGSAFAAGGMKTKLDAARIAAQAGCRMVLAHGREPDVITRIVAGEELGTLFMPKRKLGHRARWILNSAPAGTIRVDDGAVAALRRHKSLLPSGIIAVEGRFVAGDVVFVNDQAKAVTRLGADELRAVAGRHSREIRRILGEDRTDVVAIPEDIVFLDPNGAS
ncbi:MAG TPA: glutamate 5-kinase [Phycisphaerales bacterium]|nr:glutamate 5-kinase [Phycisphaerales bacterium]